MKYILRITLGCVLGFGLYFVYWYLGGAINPANSFLFSVLGQLSVTTILLDIEVTE